MNKQFTRNRGFISPDDQQLLENSKVAIAGTGGDGGHVAVVLARMGVGRFTLADPEVFEEENLNRQEGCYQSTLGLNKASVIGKTISDINPQAKVEVFAEGVTEENINRFLQDVTLLIDETEFTEHGIAVRLARAARQQKIPVITGLNVGFGAIVTSFQPDGLSLERYLGLNERDSLDVVAKQRVGLKNWLTRIPSYVRLSVFEDVEKGTISPPSVAPGVSLTGGVIATEAYKHLTAKKVVSAPKSIWLDAYEQKLRIIRFPAISISISFLKMKVRDRNQSEKRN